MLDDFQATSQRVEGGVTMIIIMQGIQRALLLKFFVVRLDKPRVSTDSFAFFLYRDNIEV